MRVYDVKNSNVHFTQNPILSYNFKCKMYLVNYDILNI